MLYARSSFSLQPKIDAMYVLGINAYHGDASACLLLDGQLLAAAEEERFLRIKHWAGFPTESIRYCLQAAGIKLDQVEHIAINRDPKANFWRKVFYTLTKRPDIGLVMERLKNAQRWQSIETVLQEAFPDHTINARIHHIEHHLSHLASSFFVSGYDDAVVVSVDGFGDFASAAWGLGDGTNIQIDGKVYFPHSLGIFYQAMTQYLGFPNYGDEYKLMGLAPYGEPTHLKELRQLVQCQADGSYKLNLKYFRHATDKVEYEWLNRSPVVGKLYASALEELLGKARDPSEPLSQQHKNLARSTQAIYEEALFHLLNALHKRYQRDNLCLSGGCAMNSVANGKIYQQTPFKKMYAQAAAGDAGGAIGAAYVAWFQHNSVPRQFIMDHAYWGPGYTDDDYKTLLDSKLSELQQANCSTDHLTDHTALCEQTAQAITEGKVIGWFQGRMEWGPRALGNRSILCDPRRADMKAILNQKIKRRESFRPFAPAILREAVTDWFETDDEVPFMMKVFTIHPQKRAEIPAVTHVDGSGRLQTVEQQTSPLYYQLIKTLQQKTGVPIILNTSFNENEPIVCRPEEALDCFLRTKMDVLVLGDYFISRRE
jgi:carbamoyltransferase